jgi:CheY-like chemotaxis protein
MLSEAAMGRPCALIVDDNRASATVAGIMLQAAGWDSEFAQDGFEAVTRLRQRPYAVVVLDYRLPGMDGVEVMTWINRNLPSPPDVVVLSSEAVAHLERRFGGLGVKAILSKPVAASDLCRAISA